VLLSCDDTRITSRRDHVLVLAYNANNQSALALINVVNQHWARLVLGWVSTWMGDRLQTGKPSRYVTNHLGQLSLPSLRGRQIEYRPVWLGLRQGVFTCVGWQVTLCDPTWQVTLCSCVSINSYALPFTFYIEPFNE